MPGEEFLGRFQNALASVGISFDDDARLFAFLAAHHKAWRKNVKDPPISLCITSNLIAEALDEACTDAPL